ncbi:MAG: hypothetical protein JWM87_1536 [Candidatus Eremiobacteraeota bacterium]|nr:hypothetical protein [Candidatus Eremiobacteraeota bacterium]
MAPLPHSMARPIRALTALGEAKALFAAGRYDDALRQADETARGRGAEAVDAAILAARVELRRGACDAVVARLDPIGDSFGAESTIATLRGIAHYRLNNKVVGIDLIECARRAATDAETRSEASYYRAWAAYADRDLDVAEKWVVSSLDEASGAVYARGLALSAWISEAREDYIGAKRFHRLALSALRSSSECDYELTARILHALAVFAAETCDGESADFVRSQASVFIWPASALDHEFQTKVHLALARVNYGEIGSALDEFEAAECLAGERVALKAQVRLEIADLYRLLGEPIAATRSLNKAAQWLRDADWKRPDTTDEMALLESACLAARLTPSRAAEWIARYSAAPKNDVGWSPFTGDRRVQALELHARGIVEAAIGDRGQGVRRLGEAAELWERLGYRRRAAYAAADLSAAGLRTATNRIARLLADSPDHPLVQNPESSLAESESTVRTPDCVTLWPSERRVLEALCSGLSVKQMAQQWGRSEFTIRNHLKRLFSKFNVRSSAALVAAALRDGLGLMPVDERSEQGDPEIETAESARALH